MSFKRISFIAACFALSLTATIMAVAIERHAIVGTYFGRYW